jgi:hypothetical protein
MYICSTFFEFVGNLLSVQRVRVMAIFNNISDVSRRSILLVELLCCNHNIITTSVYINVISAIPTNIDIVNIP